MGRCLTHKRRKHVAIAHLKASTYINNT